MEKNLLFFLDTDDRASPFDIYMGYEAGFDIVIPYPKVTADETEELVQDIIFPGGPQGVKQVSIFIGGSEFDKVTDVLETAKEAMFEPFEASIVVDPQGAYTTASALVSKAEASLSKIREGGLEGKKVTIVAGTGPVGQIAAELCANAGAETLITETWGKVADQLDDIAEEVSERVGTEVEGMVTTNDETKYEAIKDADVILSTGAEGIRTISEDVLEKLDGKPRVICDTNAVPPTGIEGLDPNDDMERINENLYGIGALAIGNLKKKIELTLLEQAKQAGKGIYDHQNAFELAREKVVAVPEITS
ncbi:hypothetical protein AKJ39_00095 [candidate division MSBL1 archaeon SCGC-AAA259J03]|uniref:Methylene-tetrahydromethanopterin dehydrogenase N-terminal domain-containing protein n=1 Tax=candidate division MSBL1 archaeon SCGC-AAA259J03 TaxID=1698269 RepID=A0A656YXF0_9EURY|nr:hypothetical protein AKJ39_00095 [candidate division MSBL1 archaeon SCGC-AAA259J03]